MCSGQLEEDADLLLSVANQIEGRTTLLLKPLHGLLKVSFQFRDDFIKKAKQPEAFPSIDLNLMISPEKTN